MTCSAKKVIISSLIFIFSSAGISQNTFESHLSNILEQGYGEEYIKGYAGPFATAFGTGMGGAIYHRAYTKGFPRLDAGLSLVYVTIPEDAKSFVFGSGEQSTFFGSTDAGSSGIPGSGLENFLIQQLQINLGLISNFELMARGFRFKIDEVGEIATLGLGIKYGLSDIVPIPAFPLDLSVQAIYQTMNIDEWLSAATFGMNIQASHSMLVFPLDIYAGAGFESSSMTLKTNEIPDIGPDGIGDVSLVGDNSFRFNLGISWTLLILNVHADYNIGEYNSIGGGVMIVF